MERIWHRRLALALCLWGMVLPCLAVNGAATNFLAWNKATDRVDADVRGWELVSLLEWVATETGWQVYVEPEARHRASVRFQDLPSSEALRRLLGDLNFALVPQTNASPRLYVFRADMQTATRLIRPLRSAAGADQPRRVFNQLIVRLKPGGDIAQYARAFGAKVVGRIPELDTYLLEFEDAATTEAARHQLATGPDVANVDYNYYFDQPEPLRAVLGANAPPLSLQLRPPGDSGRVIVGLIDTAVQPLGGGLDAFFLKQISVAGEASHDPSSPTHGTTMAETILRSLGMATKGSTSAQILPVDVYGPNGETTTWNVAQGILQAVNGGATVLNLSLGGTGDSAALRDLVKSVVARGIPIYAAAGNEPVATPFFPAAYPDVVAVTAGEKGRIASYANHGSFVDLAAPDSNVILFGDQPWYVRGTSAATAFTTGMAAGLADSAKKSWAEIQAILQHNFPVPAK